MFKFPSEHMSDIEKFMYLKSLEKEVKDAIKILQTKVKADLEETGFYNDDVGNLKKVTKTTTKPKDSLSLYLRDLGLFEVCRNDGIDLGKVQQLVEAGVIDEEALEEHLERTESAYLKFSKKTN